MGLLSDRSRSCAEPIILVFLDPRSRPGSRGGLCFTPIEKPRLRETWAHLSSSKDKACVAVATAPLLSCRVPTLQKMPRMMLFGDFQTAMTVHVTAFTLQEGSTHLESQIYYNVHIIKSTPRIVLITRPRQDKQSGQLTKNNERCEYLCPVDIFIEYAPWVHPDNFLYITNVIQRGEIYLML